MSIYAHYILARAPNPGQCSLRGIALLLALADGTGFHELFFCNLRLRSDRLHSLRFRELVVFINIPIWINRISCKAWAVLLTHVASQG